MKKYFKWVIPTAVIFLMTMTGLIYKLPGGEYIHIGDFGIYALCLLVPTPTALTGAVLGTVLADAVMGAGRYILPTLIIKSATVILIHLITRKIKSEQIQDICIALTGVITVIGYFIADIIVRDTETITLGDSLAINTVQMLVNAVLFMIFSGIIRKKSKK